MSAAAPIGLYECSGIRIASEIELSAPKVKETGSVDVTLVMGEPRSPAFERPSAMVIAELVVEGYPWYTFCRVDNGYVGRMPGIADFVIDADLRRVVCHPVIQGRSNVIPIVVPGTVTAFLLAMSGRCVLHASAVDLGGRALAFVGISGQGKSTMAAIFCAAGASLVTDDVLPLEFDISVDGFHVVQCVRSGNEIRLRSKSASLAERFSADTQVRITEDERHAVMPASTDFDRLPLAAIVLPRPDREHSRVTVRALGAGEASLSLGRCERIEGWQDRDHLRQQFIEVGRIVTAVPVFEACVPWGPPFADDLAQQILHACGLTSVKSASGTIA